MTFSPSLDLRGRYDEEGETGADWRNNNPILFCWLRDLSALTRQTAGDVERDSSEGGELIPVICV